MTRREQCPTPTKMIFGSKAQAKKFIKRTRGNGGGNTMRLTGLHPFFCPCGYWHIGHRKKGKGGTNFSRPDYHVNLNRGAPPLHPD